MPYLRNDRDWVHVQRGVMLGFGEWTLPVHYREVQRDRGPTGSSELFERKGSQRGPKYPRRILFREMPRLWKERQGPIGSPLGKGPIESSLS